MNRLLLYSLLIFLTALAGGVAPLLVPHWHENRLKIFICFGAGLLLGMALLHMLPEAAHMIPENFGFWFLFGFLLLMLLERFLMVHPCDEHEHHHSYHAVGVAAFAGLTVHGIIEGFALASSLMIADIGPLVLVAILAHKAPQGFALTTILKLARKTPKQILGFVTGVALSGPLGAVLAYGLISTERLPSAAGILLAVSAGTFLYIGACDLLPELHKDDAEKKNRLIAFMIGIGVALLSGYFLPEHRH